MYLMSWNESDRRIEASLGGRVTAEEMQVFAGEIDEIVASFEGRSFDLLIDYSRAKEFDRESMRTLREMKDKCLAAGASQIVSVARDEDQLARETTDRLNLVLEGRERVVLEAPWGVEEAAAAAVAEQDFGFGIAA